MEKRPTIKKDKYHNPKPEEVKAPDTTYIIFERQHTGRVGSKGHTIVLVESLLTSSIWIMKNNRFTFQNFITWGDPQWYDEHKGENNLITYTPRGFTQVESKEFIKNEKIRLSEFFQQIADKLNIEKVEIKGITGNKIFE